MKSKKICCELFLLDRSFVSNHPRHATAEVWLIFAYDLILKFAKKVPGLHEIYDGTLMMDSGNVYAIHVRLMGR